MVPPPPPAPPPPPSVELQKPVGSTVQNKTVDRSALLSQIHHGTRLKKTVTNDRSSPLISGNKSTGAGKDKPGGGRNEVLDSSTGSQSNGPVGQLGSLFVQGMPKLKPTNRSFLEGGNYKSQLTARLGLTSRTPSNFKLPEKPDFKTRISVSQPATPQIQRQKLYGQPNGTVASHDNLNLVKMGPSKISPIALRNLNDSAATAPLKETPTGSTSVPVSNFRQGLTHQSYLHQTDSSKWGGSDPNLSVNLVKPRTSSKPLPPPKSDNVLSGSNVSVAKHWPPARSRSFEEDKMEKTNDLVKTEKPGFLNTPPSLPKKNPSEPSELHKLQNHTAQPSALHPAQNKSCEVKSVIKPTGAPPPLPSRPPMQVSPHAKNFRQSAGTRSSPLVHPVSAPPPPPRVIAQTNTSQPKCPQMVIAPETKTLPPVLPAAEMKLTTSDASPFHSSEVNPLRNSSDQPPAPPIRKIINQSVGSNSSEVSGFESRFQGKFHDAFEFPKPDGFKLKKKIYPSSVAKQRTSNNAERSRLPPPVAPPPPPPPTSALFP